MFINPNFVFNGVLSDNMNICISQYKNSDIVNQIGFEYNDNIELTKGINGIPIYQKRDGGEYEIVLNLLLYDRKNKRKLKWTNEIQKTIYNWLITDDFVEFISADNERMVYYLKVVNIKKFFTFNNEGYLEVTFKSLTKYAYYKFEDNIIISGLQNTIINNLSNQICKPVIEITNLGDINTINKIDNLEIKGLNRNQNIIIDNATYVVKDLNTNENLFNKCNRKWVSLQSGVNNIKLNGNMNIKIKCRFPIVP